MLSTPKALKYQKCKQETTIWRWFAW